MKLQWFQGADGGCLLIEGRSGHRILCDGGSGASMAEAVAPVLAKIAARGDGLHLLCATHADNDALAGVLGLLEASLHWRVHDYHRARDDAPAAPRWPRLPRIGALWHNRIDMQVGAAAAVVEPLLAAQARALRASRVPALVAMGRDHARIALALPRAARLSRLCDSDLLDIALDRLPADAGGPTADQLDSGATAELGSLRVTRLAPVASSMEAARLAWRQWPDQPLIHTAVNALRQRYVAEVHAMAEGRRAQPLDLRDWDGATACLAARTPPLAPLAMLVEEAGKAVLLTGDADNDELVDALQRTGRLQQGRLPLLAMTVCPPPGLSPNPALLNAVSADHYLIWGDGSDGRPTLDTLEAVLASRLTGRQAGAGQRPFTVWIQAGDAQSAQIDAPHRARLRQWADAAMQRHAAGSTSDGHTTFAVLVLQQRGATLPTR